MVVSSANNQRHKLFEPENLFQIFFRISVVVTFALCCEQSTYTSLIGKKNVFISSDLILCSYCGLSSYSLITTKK